MLGEQARTAGLMWLMDFRRPIGWRQWAEVVDKQYRNPRFIGDMPHTWCGSDFVRSILTMLAYEREADSALVLASGVSQRWQLQDAELKVDGLRTRWGPLQYHLKRETRREGDDLHERYTLRLEKQELRIPPGGIVLTSPQSWRRDRETAKKVKSMKVTLTDDKGKTLRGDPNGFVTVRSLPAEVRWEVQVKGMNKVVK